MTIRPGPTTASSVFSFADSDVLAAWSSSLIVPRAPRMSPTCASSSTAERAVPTASRSTVVTGLTSFTLSGSSGSRHTLTQERPSAQRSAPSKAKYQEISPRDEGGHNARRRAREIKFEIALARAWDVQGQRRGGPTSARTIRVHRTPPFVRGACARLHTRHRAEVPSVAQGRGIAVTRVSGKVASLVRALALHGVAMLRSHLASTLRPGRGVLIRSVSRRLGSVACVREDASPNEVSDQPRMPARLPECQTGHSLPSCGPAAAPDAVFREQNRAYD
jgi:hypothetical protein